MIEIVLDSEQQRKYCLTKIKESSVDGKETVVFKKTNTDPTYKQQKLWFLWCREVSISGLGQDNTVDGVHVRAKWMFVRPLLLTQSEVFTIIYNHFMSVIAMAENKKEMSLEFARGYIHTNELTKENRIKSLEDFQRYWIGQGVNLTDPSLMGLDKYLKNT